MAGMSRLPTNLIFLNFIFWTLASLAQAAFVPFHRGGDGDNSACLGIGRRPLELLQHSARQ
jgi:hypothetical protein